MGLELADELTQVLRAVVDLVVLSVPLILPFVIKANNLYADGLQGAKRQKHDIICIILLNNLQLGLVLRGLRLILPHKSIKPCILKTKISVDRKR